MPAGWPRPAFASILVSECCGRPSCYSSIQFFRGVSDGNSDRALTVGLRAVEHPAERFSSAPGGQSGGASRPPPFEQDRRAHHSDAGAGDVDPNGLEVREQKVAAKKQQEDLVAHRAGNAEKPEQPAAPAVRLEQARRLITRYRPSSSDRAARGRFPRHPPASYGQRAGSPRAETVPSPAKASTPTPTPCPTRPIRRSLNDHHG